MAEKSTTNCPNCSSKNIKKAGIKKNKLQSLQKYFCKQCKTTFTLQPQKNKTHPISLILTAISLYNLGNSQTDIVNQISRRFRIKPSQKTISNWINQYKQITTFQKLRNKAKKLFRPEEIIEKREFLHNNLPYTFQYHKAKLELLFKDIKYNNQFINQSKYYEPIKDYLEKIPTKKFPHHIFKQKQSSDAVIAKNNFKISKKNNENLQFSSIQQVEYNAISASEQEQRASQLKFEHLKINHLTKTNLANKLTSLALNLAKSNKDRHQKIQDFMLINDSTTIAIEVPVYLTKDDIVYFLSRGFQPHLVNHPTPITGHIDLLQIRNGLIHILDYKPEAHLKHVQEQAIQQLTIYALALASKTKLALSDFKCAFFDENHYFEFFPLHAVYNKK